MNKQVLGSDDSSEFSALNSTQAAKLREQFINKVYTICNGYIELCQKMDPSEVSSVNTLKAKNIQDYIKTYPLVTAGDLYQYIIDMLPTLEKKTAFMSGEYKAGCNGINYLPQQLSLFLSSGSLASIESLAEKELIATILEKNKLEAQMQQKTVVAPQVSVDTSAKDAEIERLLQENTKLQGQLEEARLSLTELAVVKSELQLSKVVQEEQKEQLQQLQQLLVQVSKLEITNDNLRAQLDKAIQKNESIKSKLMGLQQEKDVADEKIRSLELAQARSQGASEQMLLRIEDAKNHKKEYKMLLGTVQALAIEPAQLHDTTGLESHERKIVAAKDNNGKELLTRKRFELIRSLANLQKHNAENQDFVDACTIAVMMLITDTRSMSEVIEFVEAKSQQKFNITVPELVERPSADADTMARYMRALFDVSNWDNPTLKQAVENFKQAK